MTLAELHNERLRLQDAIRKHATESDKTGWNDASTAKWNELNAEYDRVKAQLVEEHERQGDVNPFAEHPLRNLIGRDGGTLERGPVNKDLFRSGGTMSATASRSKYTFRDQLGRLVEPVAYGQSIGQGVESDDHGLSVGEILAAVFTGEASRLPQNLVTTDGTSGGFMVPASSSLRVIDAVRNQSSVLRAGIQTVRMDTPELTLAKVTGDPSGQDWVGEGQVIPTSTMTFGRIILRARKLATIIRMSSELIEDATGIQAVVENALSQQMALTLDAAVLHGTPTPSRPSSIRHTDGITLTDVAGALSYDHLVDSLTPIEQANHSATAWIVHPTEAGKIRKLKDGSGNYLSTHPDIAPLQRLVSNQQTQGEITIGDFSEVILGIRRNLSFMLLREGSITEEGESVNLAETDQVALRVTMRCDAAVMRPAAFNVLHGIT